MGTVVPIRESAEAFTEIGGRYLSLTGFERDGSAVATPVRFVHDFERLLVLADAGSAAVERIRRDPAVVVASCTARGALRGAEVRARAEVLPDIELPRVERLMGRKYRIDEAFTGLVRAVRSLLLLGRPLGAPVVLAITPQAVPERRAERLAA